MLKEFVEKLLELNEPMAITIDGSHYSNKNLKQILKPLQETLVIATLEGLVSYIQGHVLADYVFHIKSPIEVVLLSKPDADGRITTYAKAVYAPPNMRFGSWLAMEDFIINAMAMFEDSEERSRMFQIVGNLTEENTKTLADDGVTQRVTVRSGIAKVESVDVRNPFALCPYRTFPEVAQPSSKFILRIEKGNAALFEVQDRLWVLAAIKSIKGWLEAQDEELKIIA